MSQAAITPLGELKMCLMIDEPKYKIATSHTSQATSKKNQYLQNLSLKLAWMELKQFVKDIKPDGNYQCARCELESFCKWCPARSWLMNRSFTDCDPESKKRAKIIKDLISNRVG